MKTIGEISESHGFNSVSDYVSAVNLEIKTAKEKSFNVGDEVKLKLNYRPTHFNDEKILSKNKKYLVTEKSNFTLDNYSIKIKCHDIWFSASVFSLFDE